MSDLNKQELIVAHSNLLVEIINENKFKKFAEIGVWKGRSTKRILGNTDLDEYWGVDPWLAMPDGTRVQRKREQWQWDAYHMYACGLILYYPQFRVIRSTSELAAEMFPDHYFDMVYIDARHECEFVDEDIGFWYPKVREGGIISGHDYGGKHREVKIAVHGWFEKDELEVFEISGVWMKRK